MGTLLIIVAVLIVWLVLRVQPLLGHPHIERLDRFHSSLAADREKVVICLGDSLTQGNVSFDYVHALASRLEPWGYTVLNAGINGDLAWNILQRLDRVVASEPAFVVLLVGTNDACGSEDAQAASRYKKTKKLPQLPDEDFFFESYRDLLDGLESCASARVIPITLPPVGEQRGGAIDDVLGRFNQFIEAESERRGLACVPFGRSLRERLLSDGFEDSPAYQAKNSRKFAMKSIFFKYVMGWSWDRISERHRMKLLSDLIHLNEASGSVLADLVESEIKGPRDAQA